MDAGKPVAIVTGAGSGIGREIARLLAAEGYELALVGRRPEPLRETDAEALAIAEDLSRPEGVERVVSTTLDRWGRVDVLVNNAGAVEMASLQDTSSDLLHRMFAVNAYGPMHLVAALWPVFQRQGGGCVVNVSSIATIDPFPGLGVYAAAKAALESLTRSIVNEGRGFSLRAFSIAPGAVETPMLRSLFSADDLPPSRTLDPAAVASVVMDCIAGRRESDNGSTITVPSG